MAAFRVSVSNTKSCFFIRRNFLKKPIFYTEFAYIIGLLLLALGTALMSAGGFGISMVVAPAYILHLKLSQALPFFSFGMAEYVLQTIVLIIMMCMLRQAKICYLFTIVTAVLYGFLLDAAMALMALLPQNALALRILYYCFGTFLCAFAISLLLRNYLPPAAYELFVKEAAAKFQKPIATAKTIYDCASLLLSLCLSLAFFGSVQGIGIGTVICAILNGMLIQFFTKTTDKLWSFRHLFTGKKNI
jgi:uncharacterized membrane protein YczE